MIDQKGSRMSLEHIYQTTKSAKDYPIDDWSPPFCGDSQMKITKVGDWLYQGTKIARFELVSLFSSLLRADQDGVFLITPHEKLSIEIEDAAFVVTDLFVRDSGFGVRTLTGQEVCIDQDHPLRFCHKAGFVPYILIKKGLEGRFNRAATSWLIDHAIENNDVMGISSFGQFFTFGEAPS